MFLTFEGIEGCGKSTQLLRLADRLRAGGTEPKLTREPGGTELGVALRSLLLEDGGARVDPAAELMLYAADRAQHIVEIIRPALEAGSIVLCDRFLDATLAYQGHGRGLPLAPMQELHRNAPLDLRPDRTLLFDLTAEVALGRARRRNEELGVTTSEGRFENEALAFHRRVRDGYLALALAEPRRIRVIDADGTIDAVSRRVCDALGDLLPQLEEE